jgi:hypothetical protein
MARSVAGVAIAALATLESVSEGDFAASAVDRPSSKPLNFTFGCLSRR